MTLLDDLADERRALADLLESLDADQWRTPTLCDAWTVHDMAAHLVAPVLGTTRMLVSAMLRSRGNPARLGVLVTDYFTGLTPDELVAALREHADVAFAPPVVGIGGPWTDALVHGEDVRVPLGITDARAPGRWGPALDFLLSRRARVGGFLPGAAPHLTYAATDSAWTGGAGPRVEAPAAALALALTGRVARLDELAGPGSEVLRAFAAR